MRSSYQNRGFRQSGSRFHNNSSRPAGRGGRRASRYAISESDLIKNIEYSKQAQIATETEEVYVSENSFESFNLDPQLLRNIKAKNYINPSPIQDKAIPTVMKGQDLIGIANTGTGKTAAFLIPLINKVVKDRSQKVLIITPTRELAEQIENDFKSLALNMQLYSVSLIGGKSIRQQISYLFRNPNFVIGTPGRIKDLISRRVLDLGKFHSVVLDETDRMVDIGFIKEIEYFIKLLPLDRQSLFFSATISNKVDEILHSFVRDAVTISVKKTDTLKNIQQEYVRLGKNQLKVDCLHDLLIKTEFEKVMVFGNTKWEIQKLTDELIRRGFKAGSIHGDKSQSQRHTILEKFRRDEINILLATDVAARGLDINNVSHVINYEIPETHDDYTHRIGRTGRANKSGIAITLVNAYRN